VEKFDSVEAAKRYYEEQLSSQHGMLTSAINSLMVKREELETALEKVNVRNQELSKISSRTFHDMREPMVALLGLVKMLKEEVNNQSVDFLLKMAETSIRRLDNFSLALAEYVNAVQIEFNPRPIVSNIFFKNLLLSIQRLEGFEKVKVSLLEACNTETIFTYDPEKLTTILKNIVGNAIRYRDINKPTQEVHITMRKKRNYVLIGIKDNGMGIPKTVYNKVTDMFYKGTNRSTGSGLGLYIAKTILHETNDELRIRSKENVGTSIVIVLKERSS